MHEIIKENSHDILCIDSKDKREKMITLTEEGYAGITNARKVMVSTKSILLASLSEEESKQFHSLLDKVWNSLDKDSSSKKISTLLIDIEMYCQEVLIF